MRLIDMLKRFSDFVSNFTKFCRFQLIKNLPGYFLLVCICWNSKAQNTGEDLIRVYLFPGQGSDSRIFQNLKLDSSFELIYIHYPVPEKGVTMKEYALSLTDQIDTTEPFILMGVSLGGMFCTELSGIIKPEKTIIISSASERSELPLRYTFMKHIPIYRFIPACVIKAGAFIAQPIVEPDRRHGKDTFISMLRDKNPDFLKRTTEMIINWDKTERNKNIIHLHGTSDHTLPIRRVQSDYTISNGSHMMVFTRGKEVSTIVNTIISGTKQKRGKNATVS
jgi:hypothetical protein